MLGEIHPLVWIALIPVVALVPAIIAYRKGYPFFEAWLMSTLFLPGALLIVPFLPAYKVCRYCLERIKAEASACRHCGRWQDTTPDPLTRGVPLGEKPAMDGPGEQRLHLGAGATETDLGDGGDDRRSRNHQELRSAWHTRRPSGRTVAVGVGLLAAAVVAVFVLPGTRAIWSGGPEPLAEAVDADAAAPYDPGPVASATPAEKGSEAVTDLAEETTGPAGDSYEDTDAVAEPSGDSRSGVPGPLFTTVSAEVAGPAGPLSGPDAPPSEAVPAPISTPAVTSGDTVEPSLPGPPTEAVRQLQAMLTELGYDPGPVDGIMGTKTETALRQYESANNVAAGSSFDRPLLPTRVDPLEAADGQPGPISLLPNNIAQ